MRRYKLNLNLKTIPLLNIILIFILLLFTIHLQKYTTLIIHDFIYPWFTDLQGRFPGQAFNFIFTNFLPNLFNINPNDFRSGFGLGSIILSVLFILICLIQTKAFFLNEDKENVSLINQKETLIVLPIIFLGMTLPLNNLNSFYIFYWKLEDLSFWGDCFFVYLPYFYLLITTYNILINNKSFNHKAELILCCIISFALGAYNELFNLSAFFYLIIFIGMILIKDKDILIKNKNIMYVLIPFFCGMFYYYIICNNFFDTSIAQYHGNFNESFKNSFQIFPNFSKLFFIKMFINKIIYYYIIAGLIIGLITYSKQKCFHIIAYSLSILLGYIITNFLTIFVTGIKHGASFLFEQEVYDTNYGSILFFIIITLTGYLYFQLNKNKYIIKLLILSVLLLSTIFTYKYPQIQNEKYRIKLLNYYIDQFNLIYASLGEFTILPESILKIEYIQSNIVLPFETEYYVDEYSDFFNRMRNRYFNAEYYLYRKYFNKIYNKDLVGIIYKDDEVALEELKNRLEIFDDKLEKSKELKNNISFEKLQKKYKHNFTIEDFDKIEKEKGHIPLLTKARAYIYYKDKNYDKALELYQTYLKDNPEDIAALLYTADIYYIKKQYNKAEDLLKKLHKKDEQNLIFLYKLLLLYTDKKSYYDALNICNKMIEIEERMYSLYINRAIIYAKLSENKEDYFYKKSKETLLQAKQQNKKLTELHLKNNYVKTIQSLKKMELMSPTYN